MTRKPPPKLDVLVLGDHPCAYLAAALMRQGASAPRVGLAIVPGAKLIDRLVVINPALFELHPILSSLKRKLELTSVYGLQFLSDDPKISISHSTKNIGAYV